MLLWILVLSLCLGFMNLDADILIYGDTRNHPEIHIELIRQVQKKDFTLVFHTGDQNQKGTRQTEYDSFLEIIAPLDSEFHAVRGNHERDLKLFLANFPGPQGRSFYSFADEDFKYIILDSNISLLPLEDQYNWLVQELERADLPVIIFLHHPVFSSGAHGQELGLELYLPNLFKRYNVTLVVSGHEHSLEHLVYEDVHYLVSGGGGAPLREMNIKSPFSQYFNMMHHYNILRKGADSATISSYDLKGNKFYEFEIPLVKKER